ncbi:hypothetical protein CVN68_11835 [Sphingomonas psychrotolerans]|uniref:YD repeat-containing protein n=1 Tax=Sphingomonas psychrotolerans TaxID=1327635 RepID=A0A2K8MLE7_9SPHN|nr:hypothetical protein CVN68_11835 [Sphingomonas psychrotolerans]
MKVLLQLWRGVISQPALGATVALIGGWISPAVAQEASTYTYDALGRLIQVTVSGGPNAGTTSTAQFDASGNRSRYSVTQGGGGGGCILTAESYNYESSGEASVYPALVRSGACSTPISVSFTTQYVSGGGGYDSGWHLTSAPFDPNDNSTSGTKRTVRVSPYPGTIPAGDPLQLKIVWVITSGNATFARDFTNVTFYNEDCFC